MRKLLISTAIVAGLAFVGGASSFGTDTEVKGNNHESTGQYLDDTAITTKVKSELLSDEGLKGLDVKVKTYKGVVQLSGFVDSSRQVKRAVEIAQGVDGVKRVENKLTLKGQQ
jgi:hyperosmotically inducible periplasmic protein